MTELSHRSLFRSPGRPPPGEPPGTLTTPPGGEAPVITLWSYAADALEEHALSDIATLGKPDGDRMLWLDVTGMPGAPMLTRLGEVFALHPLSLEDLLSAGERPKIEEYENYTFILLKALTISDRVESHGIGVFLGDRFVLSFQERSHPALDSVRDRLRRGRGRIRQSGAGYLAASIVDSVVDHHFPVVEEFDDRLETIEAEVLETRNASIVSLARAVRYDLRTIRHAIFPLHEVLASLVADGGDPVSEDTRIYLRDTQDHVAQLLDMIEYSREVAASLLESYISAVSLETNEVIRVLTMVATLFLPLMFITGLYGMNFNPRSSPFNMPELDWYWGYAFSLGLMLGTVAGMLLFFRARGWIGRRRGR